MKRVLAGLALVLPHAWLEWRRALPGPLEAGIAVVAASLVVTLVARRASPRPVLCAFDFKDVDEVVAQANATNYGLMAGVWTQNLQTALRVAGHLEAGMVNINEYPITFPQTPFSGFKESALGHEQGIDAVNFYTRVKTVNVSLE